MKPLAIIPVLPVFIYNCKLTTVVTKAELPTYQVEKSPENQFDPLKKHIHQKFFATAESLLDTLLSSHTVKLSNSTFIHLDEKDTGVSLTDFSQYSGRRNAEVPDIYLTLIDAADIEPGLLLNQMPRNKTEESGFLSRYELWKLQKSDCEGDAVYGSGLDVVK